LLFWFQLLNLFVSKRKGHFPPVNTDFTDNKEIGIAAQRAGTTEKSEGRSPEEERPSVASAS
jgi:hypothetical protein